jgi:hypothetical protein
VDDRNALRHARERTLPRSVRIAGARGHDRAPSTWRSRSSRALRRNRAIRQAFESSLVMYLLFRQRPVSVNSLEMSALPVPVAAGERMQRAAGLEASDGRELSSASVMTSSTTKKRLSRRSTHLECAAQAVVMLRAPADTLSGSPVGQGGSRSEFTDTLSGRRRARGTLLSMGEPVDRIRWQTTLSGRRRALDGATITAIFGC